MVEIKPDWAKGWGRKGAALHGSGDLGMALRHYVHIMSANSMQWVLQTLSRKR